MVAPYPVADTKAVNPEVERIIESVIEIVHSVRNARAENNVESGRWIEAQIYGKLTPALSAYSQAIETLARAKPVTFMEARQEDVSSKNAVVLVLKETEVVIPMESMVDIEAETKRLQAEIEQSRSEVARLEARLKDSAFLTRAPAAVIDKERQRLHNVSDKLTRLIQQINKY